MTEKTSWPLNELQRDDQWSREQFNHFLRSVLQAEAVERQLIVLGYCTAIARFLQKRAGIDVLAQTPKGEVTIDWKIVRWKNKIYRAFCLEDMSSSVPGSEQVGWIHTNLCDILLYCFQEHDGSALRCYPLAFVSLQAWYREHYNALPRYSCPNPINGRNLWTKGVLAPIEKVCADLKVRGFRVDDHGLVTDLLGKHRIDFMHPESNAA